MQEKELQESLLGLSSLTGVSRWALLSSPMGRCTLQRALPLSKYPGVKLARWLLLGICHFPGPFCENAGGKKGVLKHFCLLRKKSLLFCKKTEWKKKTANHTGKWTKGRKISNLLT